MNDEILKSTESTDGENPGMDALQESINAVLAGASSETSGQPSEEQAQQKPVAFGESSAISMLMDVNLLFTVELGRTQMPIKQVLELQKGSVVELNRIAGEPVDIYVNEHLMARGEVVVVDDKFGVRITELIAPDTKD